MKKFLRKYFYPGKQKKKIYGKLLKWVNIRKFFKLVDNSQYKKILIMDSLPFNFSMRQRPQQLADEFTKYFDMVYYRTGADGNFERYSDKIILCPQVNIKNFKDKEVYYYIDSINNRRNYNYIKKVRRYADKLMYDYIDEITPSITSIKLATKIFENLNKLSPDIAIATSKKLRNDLKKVINENKIVLASNGVKVEDFAGKVPDKCPEDLLPVVEQNKPVVGYYGMLAKWMNFDLLNKLSEYYPEYNFVYLGRDVEGEAKKLKLRDNVFFLGRKAYEDLYRYTYYFSCCMIPFKHGRIAKGTSPVKLYEYMAQQKPVVCTRDLIECRGYDGVLMSNSEEEFIKNVKIAVNMSENKDIKDKLLGYAKENTWAKKAEIIMKGVENGI